MLLSEPGAASACAYLNAGSHPPDTSKAMQRRRSLGDHKLASGAVIPAPESDCKLLPSAGGVQLIVFFALIREILRRNIYGSDKHNPMLDENKGVIASVSNAQVPVGKFHVFEI